MDFNQAGFDGRCEWGQQGVLQLAPSSDVVIIVDVLSFSTCVEVATSRGAAVFPYRWRDGTAQAFAQSHGAELAEKRGEGRYSLSPASLLQTEAGMGLVLPSPNGSTLSLTTGSTPTLVGCLRNCSAVALAAATYGQSTAVIPAGERWPDGSLRPAIEDWIGAGAILSHIEGRLSPEAQAAVAAYRAAQPNLGDLIRQCGSGRELIERGYGEDVNMAVEIDVSDCVSLLVDGAYRRYLAQSCQG